MTRTLAAACARHPWRTIGAWLIAIAVALGLVGVFLGGRLTTDAHLTNDAESVQVNRLLDERFPAPDVPTELVVVRSERLTVDSPAFRRKVTELWRRGRALGAIEHAVSWYTTRDPSLVSSDRHATLIPIRLIEPHEQSADRLISAVKAADGQDGFQVAITGHWATDHDFHRLSQDDLEHGELYFGLPAALVVLVLVFGALVAAFMPLLLALTSIVVALGLTALVAQQWELSVFVVNMLTGMGLALGIDYSLFVLSRFREERAAGKEKVAAIATAGATASRAVLFSGSAYVIAMFGLLLVPSTIMRSLALGAILVGIASVVAALTLLPAVLGLLGDRVNALRVPVLGRSISRQSGAEGRFWSWIVARVMRRPALSLVAAVGFLVLAASPLLGMDIGASGISALPDRLASKQGYLALSRSFPAAGSEPAEIVIDGRLASPEVRAAVSRLKEALARDPSYGAATLETSPDGSLAVMRVQVSADWLSDRALDAVKRLRADYVPAAFAGIDVRVLVGGSTAENVDYFAAMRGWLPAVFAFVLGLSFVLVTMAFRSLVIAGTAIVLNLLSVGAAYGLLVLVFQEGVGAGVLGFRQVDTVEAWIPLFLFAVLFGLSMDYQVFLLSRIRERYSQTGDTDAAISFGIGSTARLITGAALIIVAVFAGFAAGDLVMFQQMGFGIGVALLIDATIVRSVLVPAAMKLLGRWNWYLPAWLEWIPHVEVEGAEAAPASGSRYVRGERATSRPPSPS